MQQPPRDDFNGRDQPIHGPLPPTLCMPRNRFLVLEHSVLLVYASEEDWAEHREPLDDMTLSHDSSVDLGQEGGEVCVYHTTRDGGDIAFFVFNTKIRKKKNAKIKKMKNLRKCAHVHTYTPHVAWYLPGIYILVYVRSC